MYNQRLSELTLKALDNRSINKFSKECGVSTANLSRIINGKISRAPRPETLQKIAMHSNDKVSYEELLTVCNYLNDKFTLSTNEKIDVQQKIKQLEDTLKSNTNLTLGDNDLSAEALDSLLKTLAFGIEQAAIINKLNSKK